MVAEDRLFFKILYSKNEQLSWGCGAGKIGLGKKFWLECAFMARKSSKTVPAHIKSRLERLRLAMRAKKLEGFLATSVADVSYLSGFSGDDSYLLVTRRSGVLISDSRYIEQAMRECPGLRFFQRKTPLTAAVAKQARAGRLGRIGFDPTAISLAGYKQLRLALGAGRLVGVKGVIRRARMCKDRRELTAIRRSIRVAQESFLAVLSQLKVGMSELEVAARLELEMKIRGSSEPAFPTIVACGARTSMPHVQPGPGEIKPGKAILFDWGATIDGYKSDLTRVVFLDSICPSLQKVYGIVRRAGEAAMAVIKPGVAAKEVDAAARTLIRQSGYGKYFGHGLGHGIGKDIHEGPAVGPRSSDILEEGMVFTVEPGIYLPGQGGVRIENDVLVSSKGCRLLSDLPDDMVWAVRKTKCSRKGRVKKRI